MAAYPQIVDYNEAVQHPATAFFDPELRHGRTQQNALGLPLVLSGGFALTYRMQTARRSLAVRCFHRQIPAAEQKYALIAKALSPLHSSYFVDFDYLRQGIRTRQGIYPIVKMDWADGEPLGVWLDRNIRNATELKKLRRQIADLARYLERSGIAHGDIQNGNVIMAPDGVRLVDYDGMFVPGMTAGDGSETGHRHFQHPERAPQHRGPTIDRFSFIVIDVSLLALIAEPALHDRFREGGETILFRANDFADPDHSEIFRLLAGKPQLGDVSRHLAMICQAGIDAVPSLDDFRAARGIPSAGPAQTAGSGESSYLGPYPVLAAENFAGVMHQVGNRIELIGRIHSIRQGIAEYGRRRGRPYVLLTFGPWRGNVVTVTLWSQAVGQLQQAPDRQWHDSWVSVIGLVDQPQSGGFIWARRTRVGISVENLYQINVISEQDAAFRLSPAPHTRRAAQTAPEPSAPPLSRDDRNRRLIAQWLEKNAAAPSPAIAALSPPPRQAPYRPVPKASGAGTRNRQRLHALRRGQSTRGAVAAAAPPPVPLPRVVRAAPPARPAMPNGAGLGSVPGGIVIHPRMPRPPLADQAPPRPAPPPPNLVERLLHWFRSLGG